MIIAQVTYNWFATQKGDFFYDFTVGNPAVNPSFHHFVHQGKIVKSIEIETSTNSTNGIIAKVEFEDGSYIYQANINSWSFMPEDVEIIDDEP